MKGFLFVWVLLSDKAYLVFEACDANKHSIDTALGKQASNTAQSRNLKSEAIRSY